MSSTCRPSHSQYEGPSLAADDDGDEEGVEANAVLLMMRTLLAWTDGESGDGGGGSGRLRGEEGDGGKGRRKPAAGASAATASVVSRRRGAAVDDDGRRIACLLAFRLFERLIDLRVLFWRLGGMGVGSS